jgi:ABC-type multidrug transport system permease subunit
MKGRLIAILIILVVGIVLMTIIHSSSMTGIWKFILSLVLSFADFALIVGVLKSG